ncbi:MAG: glycosyltransferase family 4 protein [Candidatus Muiribacteriota bacterium]
MLGKKIKIAHIITRLIIGGAQENTLYTVDALQRSKDFDVHLISGETLGPEGKLYETGEFKINKLYVCPYLTREIEPINDIRAIINLYRYFKKHKFDIVHTHSSKAGIIGRVAAFMAGVPSIYHTIHGLPFHPFEKKYKNFIYIISEKLGALISTKIISVCKTMTIKALKEKIGRKRQYVTIYSGMNLRRYDKEKNIVQIKERRKYFGIKEKDFVFVKVARLFELKGHEFVIKALKKIHQKGYKNIKVLFVGDGILKEKLEKMASDYGIKNSIIFAGLVPPDKVPDYIEISDCVVHASLREGLARVIPQGYLMKKPVISFDVDGAWELVQNNKTGYLVLPKSVKKLSVAMIDVFENPKKAHKMALNGYEIVKKRYPHTRMVDDIIRLYKE